MKFRQRMTLCLAAVVAGLALPSAATSATDSDSSAHSIPDVIELPQASEFSQDIVAQLSRKWGVSSQESMLRLQLQDAADGLGASLRRSYPDAFGFLRIEYEPDYRIVVGVTGSPESIRRSIDDSFPSPRRVVVVEASVNEATINGATEAVVGYMSEHLGPSVMWQVGSSAEAGTVSIYVAEQVDAAALEVLEARHEVRIDVFPADDVRPAHCTSVFCDENPMRGGLQVRRGTTSQDACTSAFFVIHNGTNDGSLLTAGHCFFYDERINVGGPTSGVLPPPPREAVTT